MTVSKILHKSSNCLHIPGDRVIAEALAEIAKPSATRQSRDAGRPIRVRRWPVNSPKPMSDDGESSAAVETEISLDRSARAELALLKEYIARNAYLVDCEDRDVPADKKTEVA
ncbi:MAG: hypothetical protein QM739_06600 [Propionivibrio sp.]